MIQINELRIGNLVYDQKTDLVMIKSIAQNGINIKYPSGFADYGFEEIYPKRLTEKILVMCGFEKRKEPDSPPDCENIFRYVKDNRIIFRGEYLGEAYLKFRHGSYEQGRYNVVDLKSVHQLQNLWFSLTGQELETQLW